MEESAKYSDGGTPHASRAAVATAIGDSVATDDIEHAVVLRVAAATTTTAPATGTVPERVEVVAPASLPGGYELHCDFRGQSVVVQVPPEGVKQGQQFLADVIRQGDSDADLHGHHIPSGKWRDGICDCFANGLCHPMLWLACCCRPLAIGQILTRMGLTATGRALLPPDANAQRAARASAFKVVASVFVVFLVVDYALALAWLPYRDQMSGGYDQDDNAIPPDDSGIPAWAWAARVANLIVELAFAIYLLVLLIRTRAHVRQRYGIPERHCCPGAGCEDCCCSFWLPCCTTLQIARHTAEYDKYPAACCTETGLLPLLHHPAEDANVV